MRKLIGDRRFYKTVLAVAVPIVIQNGITNFLGLLDNVMLGLVGTEQMSGVAIANQLFFVFNLCIFGGVSGAGLFAAQFHGAKNAEGVRMSFRFKLYICAAVCAAGFIVFLLFGERLIGLFLTGEGSPESTAAAAEYGLQYLFIVCFSLPLFSLTSSYAGTLRETGETLLPMKASVVSMLVNFSLNYILIFGKLGFPALGVRGAAIATVAARVVECAIVIFGAHRGKRFEFARGLYRTVRVPARFVWKLLRKSVPLMLNEALWALGMALLFQLYSRRGFAVISGLNITGTVTNMFNVAIMSMGNAVAILVGQQLGANEMEQARDTDNKLILLSVICCAALGCILAALSPFIPLIYNTTGEIRRLATVFLLIAAGFLPVHALINCCYFTLRAGGKMLLTFVFDCVSLWCVSIPVVALLVTQTGLYITAVYLVGQLLELVKTVFGFVLVRKGIWMRNIVSSEIDNRTELTYTE